MRILTVDIKGIPSGERNNLREADVFQDYDAILINPESLDVIYEMLSNEYDKTDLLTDEAGAKITSVNIKRREQVQALLQRGGIVVCFTQSVKVVSFSLRIEGEDYWYTITNYDWLLKPEDIKNELGEIKSATGKTIDYIDSGHPFSNYLNTKPSWSAYVDKDACKNWKVLASAFNTHAVAVVKRIGLGHIILLPSYYDYHNGELLEQCIARLLGDKQITPQPA